jgi:hypothetical protein
MPLEAAMRREAVPPDRVLWALVDKYTACGSQADA